MKGNAGLISFLFSPSYLHVVALSVMLTCSSRQIYHLTKQSWQLIFLYFFLNLTFSTKHWFSIFKVTFSMFILIHFPMCIIIVVQGWTASAWICRWNCWNGSPAPTGKKVEDSWSRLQHWDHRVRVNSYKRKETHAIIGNWNNLLIKILKLVLRKLCYNQTSCVSVMIYRTLEGSSVQLGKGIKSYLQQISEHMKIVYIKTSLLSKEIGSDSTHMLHHNFQPLPSEDRQRTLQTPILTHVH